MSTSASRYGGTQYGLSQVQTAQRIRDERDKLRHDLEVLIARHTSSTGEHPIAVAELRNIVEPGSAPMYPADQGHTATCGLCCPKGNGAKWGKPWPPEPKT